MQQKFNYFDGVYNSPLIFQATNTLTISGKKFLFEKILLYNFSLLKRLYRENGYLVFFEIIERAKPYLSIHLKKKKIQKKKIKYIIIPKTINYLSQYKQVLRWFKVFLLLKNNNQIINLKMIYEYNNVFILDDNFLVNKKIQLYNYAVSNKFNKHYRWYF